MNRERWTTVFVSQGMLGAEVIKGKLELAGIPALLRYEAAGQIFGLTIDGLGRVEVTVPPADAASARSLLAETPPDAGDDTHELDPNIEP